MESSQVETFTEFVRNAGGRVHQALMAVLGPEVGSDAASEALAYAWEHWDRVWAMENPAGYVFTVGRSKGRRMAKRPVFPLPSRHLDEMPWIEPALPAAITTLSERQRVVTLLVHGGGWTLAEVAELLGVDRGTVKKHADRGMVKLRNAMEVNVDV